MTTLESDDPVTAGRGAWGLELLDITTPTIWRLVEPVRVNGTRLASSQVTAALHRDWATLALLARQSDRPITLPRSIGPPQTHPDAGRSSPELCPLDEEGAA